MSSLSDCLRERLDDIRAQGLYRELRNVQTPQGATVRIGGVEYVNFGSNDYLGLANHPAVIESAARAVREFGAGSGSSRLICGSLSPHDALDQKIAAFKQTESALSFSSGYAAALGTLCALCGREDVIILDKLVHASIVDAARLSGAKLRVFAHNDANHLEDILKWANTRAANASKRQQTLVVTESVFSMDGDRAALRELVHLKEQHGAWLMVDEAHAVGVFGESGRGVADEFGVAGQIDVQMGTLGKALGSAGGYICGSRVLIDYLINRARSFIFSTAPVPAAAAAAHAAIELAQSAEGDSRRKSLRQNLDLINALSCELPLKAQTQIVPFPVGDESAAVSLSTNLKAARLFVPAVRFPTVPRGEARLRISLTASHTSEQINGLLHALDLHTEALS